MINVNNSAAIKTKYTSTEEAKSIETVELQT